MEVVKTVEPKEFSLSDAYIQFWIKHPRWFSVLNITLIFLAFTFLDPIDAFVVVGIGVLYVCSLSDRADEAKFGKPIVLPTYLYYDYQPTRPRLYCKDCGSHTIPTFYASSRWRAGEYFRFYEDPNVISFLDSHKHEDCDLRMESSRACSRGTRTCVAPHFKTS